MTPGQIRASYRRMIRAGETIVIRRYSGSGANRMFFDVSVRARVTGFLPEELIQGSAIRQGDRKIIILAEDLTTAQLQQPLRRTDTMVIRDRELETIAIDDSTRRFGGELIAYEVVARG